MEGSDSMSDRTAGGLANAHSRLLTDASIQFDLPTYVPPKPPTWLKPLIESLRWLAPYMINIFWTAVIAGAAVILTLVFLELKGVAWRFPWQAKPEEVEPEETWRPDAVAARSLLSEADVLAARGDYDEAVHLLLRRSVEDISERMPYFLRPSLTARDIAGATLLPAVARAAFAKMARIVEAALFARRPVGVEGWREAREAYERFAFREAWA
ncbi:hypothetical protein M2281_005158 [Mesorhizobium soli]|uniref:DUF4129 domain-containing protein n=1 Tax=Pseudaminobacter soli (ex Li et al. 2025) TaxID=1295366 RepID=UPI00247407CD|nr:DUF4129 domain-containing protein [Mesorhizobium soli]MDH6234540.1 hypothetical protein [Mesorhizobium soli]